MGGEPILKEAEKAEIILFSTLFLVFCPFFSKKIHRRSLFQVKKSMRAE
jgi:hypothetical protein